jgi:hypothetical protein
MRKLFILPVALVAIWAGAAQANSTASVPTNTSTSTSSELLAKFKQNIRGTYQAWFRGPTTATLSGNTSGAGHNLALSHYLALGYKIGSKWSVSATQPFTQTIDENPANDPFVAGNPYLTITRPSVYSNEKYGVSVYGYLRYYAPVSRSAQRAVDAASPDEAGKGSMRLYLAPNKAFRDGKLNVSVPFLLDYRIASRTRAARELANGEPFRNDMVFAVSPTVGYAFTPKVEGYLEYGFDLTHSTRGSLLTKWGKATDTDYFSLGGNISLTKRLLLNPYTVSEMRLKDLKTTQLHLVAVYSLL